MLWTTPGDRLHPALRADRSAGAARRRSSSTTAATSPLHDQVLLNLRAEWPPFFGALRAPDRNRQPSTRRTSSQARERYKFYRDRGYEIRTHDLREAARRAAMSEEREPARNRRQRAADGRTDDLPVAHRHRARPRSRSRERGASRCREPRARRRHGRSDLARAERRTSQHGVYQKLRKDLDGRIADVVREQFMPGHRRGAQLRASQHITQELKANISAAGARLGRAGAARSSSAAPHRARAEPKHRDSRRTAHATA